MGFNCCNHRGNPGSPWRAPDGSASINTSADGDVGSGNGGVNVDVPNASGAANGSAHVNAALNAMLTLTLRGQLCAGSWAGEGRAPGRPHSGLPGPEGAAGGLGRDSVSGWAGEMALIWRKIGLD